MLTAAHVPFILVQPGNTPYASPLSELTGGSVYAAGGCGFRTCKFRGERLYCAGTTIAEKCSQRGTNCTSTPC
jgi:hypothetical protein